MKKTVKDVNTNEKRVLVRNDFNVPLKDGEVADDTRIRASLPTLKYLIAHRARLILCSHLGRPKGKPDEKLRLDPVGRRLSELLGAPVRKLEDCIGEAVKEAVADLRPGDVVLLENTRFHPEEKENDSDFAARLAEPADLFVNDAFGAAQGARQHGRRRPSSSGSCRPSDGSGITGTSAAARTPWTAFCGDPWRRQNFG